MQVQEQTQKQKINHFPTIPDKRYFTISEAGELCCLKPYVLRYWEQEFPQLKPLKRRGNRRYYQRRDLLLIRQIRQLLYEQGFTIEGAKTQLTKKNEATDVQRVSSCIQEAITKLETVLLDLKNVRVH